MEMSFESILSTNSSIEGIARINFTYNINKAAIKFILHLLLYLFQTMTSQQINFQAANSP